MESRLIFLPHQSGVITDEGTQEGSPARCWMPWFKVVGGEDRQIRPPIYNAESRVRGLRATKWVSLHCQEKPLGSHSGDRTANRHR